jgi:hypothetical protein
MKKNFLILQLLNQHNTKITWIAAICSTVVTITGRRFEYAIFFLRFFQISLVIAAFAYISVALLKRKRPDLLRSREKLLLDFEAWIATSTFDRIVHTCIILGLTFFCICMGFGFTFLFFNVLWRFL